MGKQKILKRFAGWKCPNHDLCKSAGNIGEKYKNVNQKKVSHYINENCPFKGKN
jgi:hypothetical protein